MRTCSRPGCGKPHHARGRCINCYDKLRSYYKDAKLVDASPCRVRISEHIALGRTMRELALTCGVGIKTVYELYRGETVMAHQKTFNAIMQSPLPPSEIGTMRRLQALARAGYSINTDLPSLLDVTRPALSAAMSRCRFTVPMRVLVLEVFTRLRNTPGTNEMARRFAIKRGWPESDAWLYIDMDDPEARSDQDDGSSCDCLDETAVEMLIAGNYTPTVRPPRSTYIEAVARLTTKGWSALRISGRLGVTVRTVERIRAEIRGEIAAPGGPRRKSKYCRGKAKHLFTEQNTRVDKNGRRHCRACENKYKKTQRAKLAA